MVNNARVILNSLITNKKYFSNVFPSLEKTDFDDSIDRTIFNTIKTVYNKYNKVPNISELELFFDSSNKSDKIKSEIDVVLNNIKDIPINTINHELMLDSTEKWIKENRFYRDVVLAGSDMVDGDNSFTTETLQTKAEEINKISFKKSSGLDYIEDAQKNFIEYGEVDEAGIKSNLELINIATGGGHKPGSLFLFLAISNIGKCYRGDTKVNVYLEKDTKRRLEKFLKDKYETKC